MSINIFNLLFQFLLLRAHPHLLHQLYVVLQYHWSINKRSHVNVKTNMFSHMMPSGDVKKGISMYLNMTHRDKKAAGWVMISTGEAVCV